MTLEFACIIGLAVFAIGLAFRTARLERNLDWLKNQALEGPPHS